MKTEQIERAVHLAERLAQAVREAHTDAIEADNSVAEMVLMDTIGPAWELLLRLKRIQSAIEKATP